MSSVKNIVKVMNFHSLIRVDKAKKKAAKFFEVENDLSRILAALVNNVNLRLDKKLFIENPNGVVLNIYIGNDMGFCGNFNHSVQSAILADKDAYKIVIGKKMAHIKDPKILLMINKDEFQTEYVKINDLISEYIKEKKVKEINVICNYYHSVSDITFERKRLFPVDINSANVSNEELNIDYVVETDLDNFISSVMVLCICYKIKIFEIK